MSLSASAENFNCESQEYDGSSNMCLELALEGERLCKSGDCKAGVAFFKAAIQAGTKDGRTRSAIYSQLGNAYFYLGEYNKAMQYHKEDLDLSRQLEDKLGEAKSSGNLGNTLKVMGRFDEAVEYCKRHLELSRELNDKLSEGRALYNLGNVYHAKGKHIGRVGHKDPGEFPTDVKKCLEKAVEYYKENLELMEEIGDVAAQGRACGNLGNTYYLLGEFSNAIKYHEQRLAIARQFGDKAAERRAHSNLGNSHIFMSQFEEALHHYKRTLALAQEIGDEAIEAQACYSLGNTCTLLKDYEMAVDFHLRHLKIAQRLSDKVGEARACWSLGNAHASLANHEKALEYAKEHLRISKELADKSGEETAKMNIGDLKRILGQPDLPEADSPEDSNMNGVLPHPLPRFRRESMEQLSLLKLTPDGKRPGGAQHQLHQINTTKMMATVPSKNEEDDLFENIGRFQSKRMDDQRCTLKSSSGSSDNKENTNNAANMQHNNDEHEDFLDKLVGMQCNRMDEQRVELSHLPGLQPGGNRNKLEGSSNSNSIPDFMDQLERCQSSRLDDQRSPLPAVDAETDRPVQKKSGATVPDEDFFSLIMKLQSGRMDDQRATVPRNDHRLTNGNVPNGSNLATNFKTSSGKKKK